MMFWFAFALSLMTNGRVDYLPEARRPWIADFRRMRRVGRGRSLAGALLDHWR